MRMRCCICGGGADEVFDAIVLKRHQVKYFYCGACGLLSTAEPYWLEEAYSQPIASLDTGIIARNVSIASKLTALLYFGFRERGASAWLDYGGGTGMLTRLMRDRGFDFRWQDDHAENLYARGFEHEPGRRYRGVTAIEVLEHTVDPLAFVDRVVQSSGAEILILTTEIYSGAPPAKDWWYYAFDAGQHVSFFQRRTLAALASRLGLHLCSGRRIHCLTKRPCSQTRIRLLTGRLQLGFSYLAAAMLESRTMPDHRMLAGLDPAGSAGTAMDATADRRR